MASLIKPLTKTAIAESLYNEIVSGAGYYYHFWGKPTEWPGGAATGPLASILYEREIRDNIVFLKKINSSDIVFGIPRYDWTTGTKYDMYDDRIGSDVVSYVVSGATSVGGATGIDIDSGTFDLNAFGEGWAVTGDNVADNTTVTTATSTYLIFNKSLDTDITSGTIQISKLSDTGASDLASSKFYVMNSTYDVYKCLFNNGTESTVQPTLKTHIPFTTSDGYVWKYMFTVPSIFVNKFLTDGYIPVINSIKSPFYSNGSISAVEILNPGSGYIFGDQIVVDGDGYSKNNPLRLLTLNLTNVGSGYTNDNIVVMVDPPISGATGWAATGVVVGEYYITGENKFYEVVVQGDTTATEPTETSEEVVFNGSAGIKFVGMTAGATGVRDSGDDTVESISLNNGILGEVNITSSGRGYNANRTTPAVNIVGDGTGASAYAVVSGGHIADVVITSRGTGYSTVSAGIESPPKIVKNWNASVDSLTVVEEGTRYNEAPVVTISSPTTGITSTATATVSGGATGVVESYTITERGTGYISTPTVTVPKPRLTYTNNLRYDIGSTGVFVYNTANGHGLVDSEIIDFYIPDGAATGIDVGGAAATGAYVVYSGSTGIHFGVRWAASGGATGVDGVLPTGSYVEIDDATQATATAVLGPDTSVIDFDNDTLTLTQHKFVTGDQVVYAANVPLAGIIGGLQNNKRYFVIVVDQNTIRLAPTYVDSIAGNYINLTNTGSVNAALHVVQTDVLAAKLSANLFYGYGYKTNPGITITGSPGTGATGVVISTFTSAVLKPVIENGQITAVHIVDPGEGYTEAVLSIKSIAESVTDYYGATSPGQGAEFKVNFGIGDLNSKQGRNELLATEGTIDTIKILHSGSGYTSAPDVIISGDGVGASGIAILDSDKVDKITMLSSGSNYNAAQVSFSGGGGSGAIAHPIIAPYSGHGSNPVKELYASSVILSSGLTQEKNQGMFVDNEYRQVGVIKNPFEFGTKYRYHKSSGSPCYVIGGDFKYDNINEDDIITIDETQEKYIVVDKPQSDPGSTGISLLVLSMGASGATSPFVGPAVYDIVSYSTGPTLSATLSSVTSPTIDKYSGDILFIDNRDSFEIDSDPSEIAVITNKTIIEF